MIYKINNTLIKNNIFNLIKRARMFPELSHIYSFEVDRLLRKISIEPFTFSFSQISNNAKKNANLFGITSLFNSSFKSVALNIVFYSDSLINRGFRESALSFAFKNINGPELNSLNLIYANTSIKDNTIKFYYLSKYLNLYNKKILFNHNSNDNFFNSIHTEPVLNKIDGPLVSIVVAAYNAKETIGLALDSLLKQSWVNLQIIVIDDASTDNTAQIIKKICEIDTRVKLICSPINVGPYVCRNLGMSLARGKWITTHDSDDIALPDRIEKQVKAMINSASLACTGSMLRMNRTGSITRPSIIGPTSSDGYLRFCFVSLMIQTDFFKDKLGAWDSVRVGGDSEMISRIKALKINIAHIDEPLMLCLDSENGLTNQIATGINDENGNQNKIRLQYSEQFTKWHSSQDCKKLSVFGNTRPFSVHSLLYVCPLKIRQVFKFKYH